MLKKRCKEISSSYEHQASFFTRPFLVQILTRETHYNFAKKTERKCVSVSEIERGRERDRERERKKTKKY